MGIFTLEIIALSFLREGYFLRYYFWLDVISTLTMILDITWFEAIIITGGYQNASKVVKIARASRASKIGANSTKLIRILRLIRLLKMYKHASKKLKKENENTFDEEKRDEETLKNVNLNTNTLTPLPMDDRGMKKVSKRMDRVR